MIQINADLHLHGLYSGGVSKKMVPKVIGREAPKKGLDLLGTSDILNKKWISLVKKQLKEKNETLEHENGTKFILQTEVEDKKRVHHVIFFPSFSKVRELREKLGKYGDLDSDGRPKLRLDGEEIAAIASDSQCLIGPAHAFTPWTAIFKEYDSLRGCYGDQTKNITFLELGLSADTNLADKISSLHKVTFLSNSDAHSPWPNKMGREFNRLKIKEISFEEIKKALKRKGGRKCILNTGLNPKEGKYHLTRCMGCYLFFRLEDARRYNWRCPSCGKRIKKGVRDRIEELSDYRGGSPKHRPEYIHTIPLSEIISLAIGVKNTYSKSVQRKWEDFVKKFGSEIKVLLEVPIEKLKKIDENIGEMIKAFRDQRINYLPGGAGKYGKILPPGRKPKIEYYKYRQKNLSEF